jgi:hypothetical protein
MKPRIERMLPSFDLLSLQTKETTEDSDQVSWPYDKVCIDVKEVQNAASLNLSVSSQISSLRNLIMWNEELVCTKLDMMTLGS